jgi:hypothetical protein
MRQYLSDSIIDDDSNNVLDGGLGGSSGSGSGGGSYVMPTGGNLGGGSNSGSQIVEPDLINPIVFINNTSNGSSQSQQVVDEILSQQEANQNTGSQTSTPKSNAIPSDTSDETKTYVDGGTTPNSTINLKKPKPNYLTLGILGIIGLLVVYKVFFNKKSE